MASLASARRRGSEVNVGRMQRAASLLAGSALVAFGLRRRGLDGAFVGLAGADLLYRGATGYCHVLGALGVDTAHGKRRTGGAGAAVEIRRSITVDRARDEIYERWRHPQNQQVVWSHFAEVTGASERGARWRLETPFGRALEWDTEIIEERAGELIRWESTDGHVRNDGAVEFRDAPGEYGTEVTLRVRVVPPGGAVGNAAARLFDDAPKLVLAKALRRFKSLAETGEIPSTDRNPSARES